MTILLIHQAFVSPKEAGGTRHYEFARICIDSGQSFVIVASNLSYLTGKSITTENKWITEQDLNGLRILRAYTYPTLHKSFFWRVISFLSFMITSVFAGLRAGPVDVVMGTSPPIFQAFSAWLISALKRRPFLLEIRDLWPEFAIDMGVLKNPILIRIATRFEKFLYRRAHRIIVNSPAYRDYLVEKKSVPAKKITLIPNGVAPEIFDDTSHAAEFRQEWQLQGKVVCTYAGALGMANDIGTILQAADTLKTTHPHIQFLIVGDGKERENLVKEAQTRHLGNVTFTGSQPKSKMPTILAASDICLATLLDIPMFKTTYPNKVFDYMAARKPTVLAIDGVIRQVIEEAQGGIFVPPGQANLLAQSIVHLAENPELCIKMGHAARQHVETHFNRKHHADAFKKLTQQLAEKQT